MTGAARREDAHLLRGQGRFLDDLRLDGVLCVGFLRSPLAHARIGRLDASAVADSPGVVAVYTGPELSEALGPMAVAPAVPEMVVPSHRPLAIDTVHYVGQAMAVVVAEDRARLHDALDCFELELDELPVVTDLQAALEPDSPKVHAELDSNLSYTWRLPGPDPAEAFAQAAHVVKVSIHNQRVHPMPMETRGVAARLDPASGELTVWISHQRPHLVRGLLAMQLRMPENRIRVITGDVGGGFGCKVNLYPEDLVVAWLALRLGRAVKWVEGRRESFTATSHGRGQRAEVELAADAQANILALRCRVLTDVGAYHQFLSAAIPPLTAMMLSGPYRIPAISAQVLGVLTHKTPTDAYRGAGKPEATFILERLMDILARRTGQDRIALRRRHFPPPEAFPWQASTGLVYDSGDYARCLDLALEALDVEHFDHRRQAAERNGHRLGWGVSSYVEIASVGPSFMIPGGGWEFAEVRVERSGFITVLTGIAPHGQGQHTTFSRLVADFFGVPAELVVIHHGDTALVRQGTGSWGSRGASLGGSALWKAMEKVRDKAVAIAANLMECLSEEVRLEAGRLIGPERELSLFDVSMAAHDARGLSAGMEPGLADSAIFDPQNFTFPSGAHAAEVEVDPQTGQWWVTRYQAVDDCGRILQPALVEGQIHGGVVQGLGQVVCEGAEYDPRGQLARQNLADYGLLRADEVPRIETAAVESPTPFNPLGAKGVGEAGTIAAAPAVVNALCHALDVEHLDMPIRPEQVWRALRS